jgi:hypothetical protein
MPKNFEPVEFESQRGRIIAEGKEAILFWVRAFRLEDDITRVHRELLDQAPGTVANITISSEHRINLGLTYIFMIAPLVDMVGICGGVGVIYYASPEFESEAYKARDMFTEFSVRESTRQGKLKEIRETMPGKET